MNLPWLHVQLVTQNFKILDTNLAVLLADWRDFQDLIYLSWIYQQFFIVENASREQQSWRNHVHFPEDTRKNLRHDGCRRSYSVAPTDFLLPMSISTVGISITQLSKNSCVPRWTRNKIQLTCIAKLSGSMTPIAIQPTSSVYSVNHMPPREFIQLTWAHRGMICTVGLPIAREDLKKRPQASCDQT